MYYLCDFSILFGGSVVSTSLSPTTSQEAHAAGRTASASEVPVHCIHSCEYLAFKI